MVPSTHLRHQDKVLDYRHQFLADFQPDDVRCWSQASRRAKLDTLNNARDYYEVECPQKQKGHETKQQSWRGSTNQKNSAAAE